MTFQLRASTLALAMASLTAVGARANAQSGGGIFCLPTDPYCFGARWEFISDPINPVYRNRLVIDVTNADGRLNADPSTLFGFLGFALDSHPGPGYYTDWGVNGHFYDPTPVGSVNVNPGPQSSSAMIDQPGGLGGYYALGGFGLEGCTVGPNPDDWAYSTCPATDHGGFLQWNIDLTYYDIPSGTTRAATFDDFALTVRTTAGGCSLTRADWIRTDYWCAEAASVTPEPGTLALVLVPMLGLGVEVWRRKRTTA